MSSSAHSVHEVADGRRGAIVVVEARTSSNVGGTGGVVGGEERRRGSDKGEVELDVTRAVEEGEGLLVEGDLVSLATGGVLEGELGNHDLSALQKLSIQEGHLC